MGPIFDDLDHAWDDGDVLGSDDIPEILDAWPLEDLPAPPDAWTLRDFADLLPDEFD